MSKRKMTPSGTSVKTDPFTMPKGIRKSPALRYAETIATAVEGTAAFLGRPSFIVWLTAIVCLWISWNSVGETGHFDPYPFVFLILLLSIQASVSAPLILFAQRRQSEREAVNAQADKYQAKRTIESVEYLAIEIADLTRRFRAVEHQMSQLNRSARASKDTQ